MPTSNKILRNILQHLPQAPGVYKMINFERRVIYVGKAKNLSKRVQQYFKNGYQHSTRTKKLVENIADIETITVDSELEAMILENNLIKQLQPKYNVIMKDDKNYVYIKITKEDFPRIQIVRKIEKDHARYIGPKTAAHKVKETLRVLKKIFPFRHCGLDIEMKPSKEVKITNKVLKYPCLDFFIKRCIAPCIGKCSIGEYGEIIKNVENFLDGKSDNILTDLKLKMQEYASKKDFERAAKTRDKIHKIEQILERQKVQDPSQHDQDIINYCISQNRAYFNLFQIRSGKLLGQENFILSAHDFDEENSPEVLSSFLKQFYELATDIPQEILLPHETENPEEMEQYINQQSNRKIRILIPKIGTKNKLLEMSLNNARIYADRNKPGWQEVGALTQNATRELRKILKLKAPLKRIECYDISHLSGTDTVGSMIVFENGVPKNSFYRKFKLKTVINKPDDYKSMEEVLYRRFSKIALQAGHIDYKIRKANKKDNEFIKTQSEIEGINRQNDDFRAFHVLEKKRKIKAFAALQQKSDKVTKINALWVEAKERGKKLGYKMLKEIVKKAKTKRVYLMCKEQLLDYYLIAGFELINEIPMELKDEYSEAVKELQDTTGGKTGSIANGNIFCLVYDKNKHKEDESFKQIPDLVIIDGGKGQLASATKIFNDLKLKITYVSLAKQLEEIFIPGNSTPILLPRNNEALKLLQRARDEAHRFAISYNKNLRRAIIKKS